MLADSHRRYGWTSHRDAMLARLVGAGLSWPTIGRLCGRTKKAAQARWSVLQSEGTVPAPAPREKVRRIRWTKAMDDRLSTLRQDGAPWAEVAVRLGVSLYAAWSRGQKIKQKEIKI
nr:MAG TPA: Transcription factor WER/DNA Complex factor, DNA BINDING PROTEIN-DNA.15A [Caudoviricetes sp.]